MALSLSEVYFTSPPPDALRCPGPCGGILVGAIISVDCGHSFCDTCVTNNNAASGRLVKCPLDGIPIGQTAPNLCVARSVAALEVLCPFSNVLPAAPAAAAMVQNSDGSGSGSAVSSGSGGGGGGNLVVGARQSTIPGRPVYSARGELVAYVSSPLPLPTAAPSSSPETGCGETMSLAGLAAHVRVCAHKPCTCPNSRSIGDADETLPVLSPPPRCCGTFARNTLEAHLLVCPFTPCRYAPAGCGFRGRPEAVREHAENGCPYASDPRVQRARELRELQAACSELRGLAQHLGARLTGLEGDGDALRSELRAVGALAAEAMAMAPAAAVEIGDGTNSGSSSTSRGGSGVGRNAPAVLLSANAGPFFSPQELALRRSGDLVMPFSFQCIGTLGGLEGPVWSLVSHENLLFATGGGSDVHVWDLAHRPKRVRVLAGHTDTVHALFVHAGRLYSGDAAQNVHVWDLNTLERIAELRVSDDIVCAICVAGPYLVTGSYASVRIWDLATFVPVAVLCDGLQHWVRALAWDMVAMRLYAAAHNVVHAWDLQTAATAATTTSSCEHLNPKPTSSRDGNSTVNFEESAAAAAAAAATTTTVNNNSSSSSSNKNNNNAAGSRDSRIFNAAVQLETAHGTIHSLELTPSRIVVGTYNKHIHVYDKITREHIRELKGHLGTVHGLAASTSGRFLFSCSIDATVTIWDLDNGLSAQTLQRHEGSVNSLLWSNGLLFSGSADATIKVYKPFRGKAPTDSATADKPLPRPELQACWGGGRLPPVAGKRPSRAGSLELLLPDDQQANRPHQTTKLSPSSTTTTTTAVADSPGIILTTAAAAAESGGAGKANPAPDIVFNATRGLKESTI